MSDDTKGPAIFLTLVVAVFLFGATCFVLGKNSVQIEAIHRGVAVYAIDETGSVRFEWKR